MKNKIIGLIAFSLTSFNIWAENIGSCGNSNSYPEEENIIELSPQEQWFQDFYISTLEDKNPILKAHAINALDFSESYTDKEALKTSLKKLFRKSNLDKRSLALIANICENSTFESICNKHDFTNKHINKDPDNLLNYLPLLTSNKDENLNIEKINKQLLKTTHFNIGLGIGASELKKAFKLYQYTHPMPLLEEFSIENPMNLGLINGIKDNELIMELFLKNQVENLINIEIISSSFMRIPAFRGLTIFCEKENTEKACSHMGKLLNSESTSQISKMMGYELQLNVFKKLNKLQNFNRTIINKLKNWEQHQCQVDKITPLIYGYMYAEPTYANQYILNIEKLGEVKATQLAQLALEDYFFDHDIQIETTSPLATQQCQEIDELSDSEFIERYQLEEEINKELAEFDTK